MVSQGSVESRAHGVQWKRLQLVSWRVFPGPVFASSIEGKYIEMGLKSDATSYGYFEGDIYVPTRDSGFFSLCSMTLFELSRTAVSVNYVDASRVMKLYGQASPGNPWDHYFRQPELRPVAYFSRKNPFGRRLRHHSDYTSLPIWRLKKHLIRYFSPTESVIYIADGLAQSNELDLKKTLVVHYRGTDKRSEIPLEDPEVYLQVVRLKLQSSRHLRVWVQTDQTQVRDYLLSELGDRAFAMPEMPTTRGTRGFHKLVPPSEQVDFAQTFLAAVLLMARCRYVITHTGNVALWTALFRGHTKRFQQLGLPR